MHAELLKELANKIAEGKLPDWKAFSPATDLQTNA